MIRCAGATLAQPIKKEFLEVAYGSERVSEFDGALEVRYVKSQNVVKDEDIHGCSFAI